MPGNPSRPANRNRPKPEQKTDVPSLLREAASAASFFPRTLERRFDYGLGWHKRVVTQGRSLRSGLHDLSLSNTDNVRRTTRCSESSRKATGKL